VQVANPAVSNSVDVDGYELGKLLMVFAESKPPKLRSDVVHRHASLPLDRLHD
jgi:hypothetical protein